MRYRYVDDISEAIVMQGVGFLFPLGGGLRLQVAG
jgi:hypothetical protein